MIRGRGRVWFTADTHFGHAGAIGRFGRPFKSVADMDQALVENWNATVSPDGEVWHLGDFAVRASPERNAALLQALNGRKHLVTGNNDLAATTHARGWAIVTSYLEMELDGVRLVLCHYPFRTWNGMYRGAYNLHGHSHGALSRMTRQVDVGVDVWDFRPIGLDAIRSRQPKDARAARN